MTTTGSDAAVEGLRASVNTNGRETFRTLASHVEGAATEQFGDVTAVSVGLPAPVYNQVMVLEEPVAADLEAAVDWMRDREVPFRVTVTEPHRTSVADLGERLDLVDPGETMPGMALASLADSRENETDARIEAVTDEDALAAFVDVFGAVYEAPTELAARASPASMLEDPDIELFVGRVDGEAVACGQLVRTGDVAGVYNIGVREGFRRRGIGEAVTWEVLRAGRDAGCDVGALQSSDMAVSLYERMGFERVVTYHLFFPESAV